MSNGEFFLLMAIGAGIFTALVVYANRKTFFGKQDNHKK